MYMDRVKMQFLYLLFISLLITFSSAQKECDENAAICMLDLLKSWETIRLKETNATNVLLPVIYYSKDSLISLCEHFSNSDRKCGISKCPNTNPLVAFVNRHFSFICGGAEISGKYIANQECITTTLMSSNCTEKIKEEPKIVGELYCPKIDEFVPCVEEPLRTSCGNEAYALVMKAVERYGCDDKIEVSRVDEFLNIRVSSEAVEANKQKIEDILSSEASITTAEITTTTETTTTVTTSAPTTVTEEEPTKVEMVVTASLGVGMEKKEVESSTVVVETTTESNSVQEEIEASGEIVTTTEAPRTRKPRRFTADNMTDCYSSIMSDFGRFLKSSPGSSFVRFPLFGFKPLEIEVLCSKFEIAEECVASFCFGNCRLPPIKSFVDNQLKTMCGTGMRNEPDFEMEYTCLQSSLAEHKDCVGFINSSSSSRCDGHSQFRECMADRLSSDCSDDTINMMDRLEIGFGCKSLQMEVEDPADQRRIEQVESSGEGSGSGDIPMEILMDNDTISNNTMADEKLLTREIKPKVCDDVTKVSALTCLGPLLRLWAGIKDNRKATEVVFPIFDFSKIELLELCDSFANYRNCIRFTDSGVCKSVPVIQFAEEHFGQVCTTQQIEASMKTHDCIRSLDPRNLAVCKRYSKGDTEPEKRKCSKVRRYTRCLRKLVIGSCGHLMLAQFDMIVSRFGC